MYPKSIFPVILKNEIILHPLRLNKKIEQVIITNYLASDQNIMIWTRTNIIVRVDQFEFLQRNQERFSCIILQEKKNISFIFRSN